MSLIRTVSVDAESESSETRPTPRTGSMLTGLRNPLPGMATTYHFECPYCGSSTSVESHYAGLTGPCYSCGKMITVPTVDELESLQRRRSNVPASASRLNVFLTIGMLASTLIGGGAVVAGLFFFFLPGLVRSSSIADATLKMEQIHVALELYHDRWGSYPPAYLPDAAGKPMHSWRVLILDELGYANVKAQYNFNLPWDHQDNMAILSQMPSPYGIDVDPNALPYFETSVVAVVGDGTMFPGKATVKRSDISDDRSTTMMLVEKHESKIYWTEPRDLGRSRMSFVVNGSGQNDVKVVRPEGAVALMSDGSTRTLSPRFSPAAFSAITTIQGGENVAPAVFEAK